MAAIILITSLKLSTTGGGDIVAISKKTTHAQRIVKEIQGVPAIAQMPELPSGCEITALTMLLNWAGANIDKQDAARAIPKGSVPVYVNGAYRGGNPNDEFIGDPFSGGGFGVYHRPIALLLDRYIPGQALDITGTSFENLLEVIDTGRPVIVWATVDMAEPRPDISWYDEKGVKLEWKNPEHSFLLVGYTDTEIIVNDPFTGKRHYYPISDFKKIWSLMGKQAVTVSKKITGNVVTTILDK